MKNVTKFFIAALLAGMCGFGYGQNYLELPKANEKVLGTISIKQTRRLGMREYGNNGTIDDWHKELLIQAKRAYSGKDIHIREMQVGSYKGNSWEGRGYYENLYYGPAVGKVVYTINPEEESHEKLSPAINKAMLNVNEGSRIAIDKITVTSGMDSEKLRDQLIDILLDKGYRVVAKEYLQKLKEEIDGYGSGLYNPDTAVKPDNFSAVGYFINVKVTETSIRVQVVNVSTGEYEGNATVNF